MKNTGSGLREAGNGLQGESVPRIPSPVTRKRNNRLIAIEEEREEIIEDLRK